MTSLREGAGYADCIRFIEPFYAQYLSAKEYEDTCKDDAFDFFDAKNRTYRMAIRYRPLCQLTAILFDRTPEEVVSDIEKRLSLTAERKEGGGRAD